MYPWQRTILDAYTSPSELLPGKINIAERAIAERLNDLSLEAAERMALRDALNALLVLIEETKPKRADQQTQKKEVA